MSLSLDHVSSDGNLAPSWDVTPTESISGSVSGEKPNQSEHGFLQKYPLDQPMTTFDGADMRSLLQAAHDWLAQHYEMVNRLNVFPVPDGDTGTNMLLTVKAAWAAIQAKGGATVGTVMAAAADGARQGSRGNSGVILSQILHGFSQSVAHKANVTAQDWSDALLRACEVAYKSVPNPIEGTILTVVREISATVRTVEQNSDLRRLLAIIVQAADQAVQRTPDLLPVLKKAGVVDSGGKGLFLLFEGMHRALMGQSIHGVFDGDMSAPVADGEQPYQSKGHRPLPVREWGFDVQFLIEKPNQSLDVIRTTIANMGDCPLVEGDENLIKVHVHVADPGQPLSYGVQVGFVTDVVVENMDDMAAMAGKTGATPASPLVEEIGLVAVTPGDGFAVIFRDLGVAEIVSGGQSMNPSTAEIAEAIRRLPNRRVIVLPNNSNILMAAQQAAELVAQDIHPRQVVVIPSKTIPQGIAALLSFDPSAGDCAQLAAQMQKQMEGLDTGEVTQAVRSAEFDGITVEVGDFIGLHNGRLVTRSDGLTNVVLSLLIQMAADESEIITIFYGDFVAEETAQNLAEIVCTNYPEQTVELVYGGQPFYHYVLATE